MLSQKLLNSSKNQRTSTQLMKAFHLRKNPSIRSLSLRNFSSVPQDPASSGVKHSFLKKSLPFNLHDSIWGSQTLASFKELENSNLWFFSHFEKETVKNFTLNALKRLQADINAISVPPKPSEKQKSKIEIETKVSESELEVGEVYQKYNLDSRYEYLESRFIDKLDEVLKAARDNKVSLQISDIRNFEVLSINKFTQVGLHLERYLNHPFSAYLVSKSRKTLTYSLPPTTPPLSPSQQFSALPSLYLSDKNKLSSLFASLCLNSGQRGMVQKLKELETSASCQGLKKLFLEVLANNHVLDVDVYFLCVRQDSKVLLGGGAVEDGPQEQDSPNLLVRVEQAKMPFYTEIKIVDINHWVAPGPLGDLRF